jgi:hypothetical protein
VNFTNTNNRNCNPQLDKLLDLDFGGVQGACKAYVDVAQFPPSTRTRIRFKTGKTPGLFVWHW